MSSPAPPNTTGYSTRVHKAWAVHPSEGTSGQYAILLYDLKHPMEEGRKAQGMECFDHFSK